VICFPMSEEGKFSDGCCKRLFFKNSYKNYPSVASKSDELSPRKEWINGLYHLLTGWFARGDFEKCSVSKAEHLGDDSSGEPLPF